VKVLKTAMADQEPCNSSEWRLAKAVRVQAFPHMALVNGNRKVRLPSEEQWAHLNGVRGRGGLFRPGVDVLYRQHYNAHGACIRVELQLASALIESKKIFMALQQQPGGILRGPVPALPVIHFTLPIAAYSGWTKRVLDMSLCLAHESLPFSVQKALGKRVSIHGGGNRIEFTGPIANRRLLFQIFSDDNMGKDGFLDWLSGEIGSKVSVSELHQQQYCQMLVCLFDFHHRQSCRLEEWAETSNDGRLALAVRTICGDRRGRETSLSMPLGDTESFLMNIFKFIGSFPLLKRNKNDPEQLDRYSVRGELKQKITQQLEILWNSQRIGPHEFQMRLQLLCAISLRLLRTSTNGPDVPLHWALHSPLSAYPRSVFSNAVFDEVVISLANILCLLFGRRVMPHGITNPVEALNELFRRAA
jgi:hypothetical protein